MQLEIKTSWGKGVGGTTVTNLYVLEHVSKEIISANSISPEIGCAAAKATTS